MLPPDGVLTVSQLTSAIKEFLESGFPSLVVEGEISGLRSTSGKHLYFSLKDESSVLKVVWFSWNSRAAAAPADGQQVRITGRLAVYEPQGTYQLVVSQLESVGLGDLLARIDRLKRQFQAEGIFDSDRKRPIPRFPAIVGCVTSATGAALQDMLRVFHAGNLRATVRVFPVAVQGADAPQQIAAMVAYAGANRLADVLVVARGGGSVEDLLAFSDEGVVRSIANCPVPVISAVGHEIDSPLCDFAADLRAPTPTAAAEVLVRPWSDLEQELSEIRAVLAETVRARLGRAKLALNDFRADRLRESFHRWLEPVYQRFDAAREILQQTWQERVIEIRHRFALVKATLEGADPRNLLKRGFAFVTDEKGTPISSALTVQPGQDLVVQFYDGRAITTIKEVVHEDL